MSKAADTEKRLETLADAWEHVESAVRDYTAAGISHYSRHCYRKTLAGAALKYAAAVKRYVGGAVKP